MHVEIPCARGGCANVICMTRAQEDRLRETHDSFVCLAGHSNYFPGKTKTEKRVDQLERLVEILEAQRDEAWREARTCQWPDCGYGPASSLGLKRHQRKAHGWPTVTEERARKRANEVDQQRARELMAGLEPKALPAP